MKIVTQFLKKAAAKSRGKKELKTGRCRNTNYTLQQYYFPKDDNEQELGSINI